jgi:Tfp pilus assembly protein PilF
VITSHALICRSRRIETLVLAAACALLLMGLYSGCTSQPIVTHAAESRQVGIDLYNEGEYADAAGSFKNVVRRDPRDYRSHFWLGQCYEKMNMPHQAIQSYKTSLDSQTTSLEGKENAAFRYETLGALAKAIGSSDSGGQEIDNLENRAREKQSSEDYILLAKIHRAKGDADSALDAYNRAVLLDPKSFYALKEYGLYLERLGQGQKAVSPLKKAYALNGADAEVADALRRLGIVPGPSLKNQKDLAGPPVPKGPIPEVDLSKNGQKSGTAAPAPSATPPNQPVQPPSD